MANSRGGHNYRYTRFAAVVLEKNGLVSYIDLARMECKAIEAHRTMATVGALGRVLDR